MLYVTTTIVAKVTQHFRENPFQSVVLNSPALFASWICHGEVTVVADIYRGAVEMARIFRGIEVMFLQARDIVFRSQGTANDDLVEGDTLYV